MSWQFDAPTMTYRNFALSSKIRLQAASDAVFMKFLTMEPGYGKRKGESVTITRILELQNATRVGELDRLPSGRPAIETKTVSVSEWGFKIPVTEKEKNLTFYDIMNPFQAMLRRQMTMTMDQMAAEALKKTPIKYVPVTTGAVMTTDGSVAQVADVNLSVNDLRDIHDYLKSTLKCPTYRNGKYMGVLSTKAARGIKNDPEYKDWLAPTTSDPLMSGILKDIEGFTLIETNNDNSLDQLSGSSTVLGDALFFGADAAGLLQVQAPEIRMGLPEDLGRFQEVGWVGMLESFLVWEKADLSRAIHVTSA